MRRLAAALMCLSLVACSGTDSDQSSTSTTTTSLATSTTAVTPVSTTQSSTTTTLAPDALDDPGESIGVTDKVTIIVTDSG